ncbi:immunity 49 family protein, partial [Alistipes sp. ZOR0009]|uniref:immunity 49 family protein n=1 Tax=Alistipes sp. ZOR0009 TaxID=1339253 RepID=UPI00064611A0
NLTYRSVYYDDDTNLPVPITMEENVLAGEASIFVHTIQQFLKGDTALVERNLNIMETLYLPKNSSDPELMKYDVNFFKALYARDRSKCEEALSALVSPKIHRARNDDTLLKKYISMPALGYAKLAWICGVEVSVKSKLIPAEL